MPISTKKSPEYVLYRDGLTGVDAAPALADEANSVNTSHYKYTNIQVIPSGGANPDVEVRWWSEEAGVFIKEHTAITKVGIGANTPFEFTVNSLSRKMMVVVTTLAAGSVKILISGAELLHPQ